MNQPTIKFKKLHPNAIIPKYQTNGAAGMDLHWDGRMGDEFEIGKSALFCTGLSVEIPEGFEGQIRPRSSLGKHGVHCYFGTIDSDYRGELMIRLQLITGEAWDVFKGDRIAQLVIAPVARATIQEVDELSETARGAGGWGSTGR